MVEQKEEALGNGDLNRTSSDELILMSRQRRHAVHYASIEEFLASLNISDTALISPKDPRPRTLSLERYKSFMRGPEA
ncbi:uncharacterized protein LOC117903069 [Drosophila subobscura]|uniref:uncharacterized protein LOC117903069 n=1 Tax=Drosophila subobscura TaxID=7241 RepID=UPI00155ACFBE|nr:uncharacterized protein LOC117903069 [Drosophila subobscura]